MLNPPVPYRLHMASLDVQAQCPELRGGLRAVCDISRLADVGSCSPTSPPLAVRGHQEVSPNGQDSCTGRLLH